jgi:hypothetical protein
MKVSKKQGPAARGMRSFTTAGLSLMATAVLVACGSSSGGGTDHAIDLSVLSATGPLGVSGGDALIKVTGDVPPGSTVRVLLNGNDVSSAFATDPADNRPVGLVSGLTVGTNTITAQMTPQGFGGPTAARTIQITNHPGAGPMFSGPHQTPFICQTADFRIYPNGPFLGPAQDANCSVPRRVDYVYRNTATPAAFVPLPSLQAVPTDVATITTNEGRNVPFIVRLETGTVNRSIYQTAMLHNPAATPAPTYLAPSNAWNGRLVYTFGGGCTGGWYRQGATTGGVLDPNILGQGYAMASSSLNVFGNNCQELTAAESMAMVKERFIETYGRPRHTIGWGCSGGSYQQHQIGDNHPGLLDGILPGCSFPEVTFATVYSITDMRLLGNYFQNTAPGTFSAEQQRQVAGALLQETIYTNTVYNGALRIAPDQFCPPVLPAEQRYHPLTNPTGARCSVYDHQVNVFGRDPATGFARRPLDNVGVQYGLRALNAGIITVDQFLDLNQSVGGYDIDARFSPQRTVADLEATRQAYQTGRLTSGGGGLRDIPIIDYRAYSDDNPVGDIHQRYHSFSMRERLIKANGDAANHVMLVEDFRYGYYSSASPLLMFALAQMDRWITAIQADVAPGTQHERVVRNKPATLQEGCNTRDAQPTFIAETQQMTAGQCAALYPVPAAPRFEAGASIAADVIKCTLKPVDMNDYTPVFSPAQQQRLQAIFPQGVCNWAVPGVEQQGLRGTWLTI